MTAFIIEIAAGMPDEVPEPVPEPITPELRKAFEDTHYTVHHEPPFTLHIGQNSPELDALLKASGHDSAAFITAWNPMCQPLMEEDNHQRQQALLDVLKRRSLRWIPGTDKHPSNGWPAEESVLVLGLQPEAARVMCLDHQQRACVTYRLRGVAQLLTA
jgi:hypothetical protein